MYDISSIATDERDRCDGIFIEQWEGSLYGILQGRFAGMG